MRLRDLAVESEGFVRRLILSGAPLGSREAAELSSVARAIAEDADVRVVVLQSRGADFCPGPAGDLDPLACGVNPPEDLAAIRAPVVAALKGAVASVGLEIALAADVRIAAPDARFSMPDVAAGRLPCWGGTQRLPRAVGRPTALAMLLLGVELDAAGLAHQVADDLDVAVGEVVATLGSLGPLALQYAKESVREGAELRMREGLKLEADLGLLLQSSADREEGIAAFLEKRVPKVPGGR